MNYYEEKILSAAIKSKVEADGGDIKNKTQVINILKNCVMANRLIEFYKKGNFIFNI